MLDIIKLCLKFSNHYLEWEYILEVTAIEVTALEVTALEVQEFPVSREQIVSGVIRDTFQYAHITCCL